METEEKMISQEKGWSQRRSGKGGGEKTSCRRKGRKIVSERQRLVIERHT